LAVALGLVLLVLLIGLLAASPQLHAALHGQLQAAHAHQGCNHTHGAKASDTAPVPEHHDEGSCAICLFAHGQWLHIKPEPAVVAWPVERPLDLSFPAIGFAASPELGFCPGRGPPDAA
jgi:hypothetical protein